MVDSNKLLVLVGSFGIWFDSFIRKCVLESIEISFSPIDYVVGFVLRQPDQ